MRREDNPRESSSRASNTLLVEATLSRLHGDTSHQLAWALEVVHQANKERAWCTWAMSQGSDVLVCRCGLQVLRVGLLALVVGAGKN